MSETATRALPASSPTLCPGCGAPMRALTLERKPLGMVTIDVCATCQALWFDAFESVQLTPGAVIALFREINAARPEHRQALPSRMGCPRCNEKLELTQDQTNLAHFSYHRCPYGHGRFTPFFQFLREKSFVRTLPAADLERLKAHIRVIHCSSCGAPVDLESQTTCSYCHAPISVLDPDAVQKALATYEAQETARRTVDPVSLVDGLLRAQAVRVDDGTAARGDRSDAVDLIALGLDVVHDLMHAGKA